MITRRKFFSIASVPLVASIPVEAATIPYSDDFDYCYNLEGIKCEWTKQVTDDMLAVHGIRVRDIFEWSYGTTFKISKEVATRNILKFTLTTNDERDTFTSWYQDLSEQLEPFNNPDSWREHFKRKHETYIFAKKWNLDPKPYRKSVTPVVL